MDPAWTSARGHSRGDDSFDTQGSYYINEEYDSSELIQRDPREISVLVVTNEDDIVKRVEIGENAWKSYLGHEYEEWDYNLFEDY